MRKTLFGLVLGLALLAVPSVALASIEFDTASSSSTSSGTSLTWSHTVASGTSRILVVGMGSWNGDVTTCTYNDEAMLKFDGHNLTAEYFTSLWYVLQPDVGTASVVCSRGTAGPMNGGAISFTGVHQTSPFRTPAGKGAGTSQTPSSTVSSSTTDVVVDTVFTGIQDPLSGTAGGGQTERVDVHNSSSGFNTLMSTSPGASSVTMSWTLSASNKNWASISASLQIAVGADDTEAPTAPTNLSAGSVTSEGAQLSWTASTDNIEVTGYRVERSPAGCGSFAEIGEVPTTNFTDSGLTANTGYCYRTRAVDAAQNLSAYSSEVTITTLESQSITLFVRFVDQQDDGVNSETGFIINRKTSTSPTWALLDTAPASSGTGLTVTYQDDTAPRTTVCYQVAATNSGGTSAFLGGDEGVCFTAAGDTLHRKVKGWRR